MKGIHRRAPKRGPIVARRGIALGLVMSLLMAGIAMADQVEGDIVGPEAMTKQVSAGSAFTFDVKLFLSRSGANSAVTGVTWAGPALGTGCAGITGTQAAAIDFGGTNWSGAAMGTLSTLTPVTSGTTVDKSSTVTVSGTAGAPGGSCSLTYTGTGLGKDIPNGQKSAVVTVTFVAPADTTPPVITPQVVGSLGTNGWYTTDVMVSWTVGDLESAISSSTGCVSTTVSADTTGITYTCSATSAGGTSSRSVTIKRDATAPTITADPAAVSGWNAGNVTVSFNCSDGTSGVASCGPDVTLSADGAGQWVTGTAVDNAGNSASATVSGINIDRTAPIISGDATTAPNGNGWYNGDVRVEFICSDALSGLASCGPNENLVGEGGGQSVTGAAVDNAGNSASATVIGINIDKTAPTLSPTVLPNTILLGAVGAVSAGASDELSRIASVSCDALDTSSVGGKFVSCTATDKAGNTATTSVSYSVVYDFAGFFRPVDNLPLVNVVKAGSAVPIKFSLRGNQGLDIFMVGYPRSNPVACTNGASLDSIEETVNAGSSSLSYDAVADQYNYVWKTGKTWTGCRLFEVKFVDGASQTAMFKFTK